MTKHLQIIFLSCKKATLLIEMSQNRRLSIREKIQLKVHVKMCERCKAYQKQSFFIETMLKANYKMHSNTSDIKLPEASKIKLKKVIEEKMKNK